MSEPESATETVEQYATRLKAMNSDELLEFLDRKNEARAAAGELCRVCRQLIILCGPPPGTRS